MTQTTPDPMTQIEALKPCPFCGDPDIVLDTSGECIRYQCNECGAITDSWIKGPGAKEAAAKLWNRRALAAQPGQESLLEYARRREKEIKATGEYDELRRMEATPPTPTPDEAGVRAAEDAFEDLLDEYVLAHDYLMKHPSASTADAASKQRVLLLAGYRAALLGDKS